MDLFFYIYVCVVGGAGILLACRMGRRIGRLEKMIELLRGEDHDR